MNDLEKIITDRIYFLKLEYEKDDGHPRYIDGAYAFKYWNYSIPSIIGELLLILKTYKNDNEKSISDNNR